MANSDMYSLSDLIGRYLYASRDDFKPGQVQTKLSPNLPKMYNAVIEDSFSMLYAQLTIEARKVNPTKILYETQYRNGMQILTISHNGRHVPELDLFSINRQLEAIANGARHTSQRHGNQLSAQAVQKYGGKVTLENLAEGGEYTVRTTVKVPIFTT